MVSCVGVSRVILVVLNVFLFFIGAGITTVGILVLFTPSTITDLPLKNPDAVEEINNVINSTFVAVAAWVCIGIGVIIIIVSLCGCLGSAFVKTTLLGIYICVILQIIVIQLGVGIIIYLSPDWFNTAVESSFELHLSGTSNTTSAGWDVLQLSVGCCGVNGTSSYNSLGTDPISFKRYETCCTVNDKSTAVTEYLNDNETVQYINNTMCMREFMASEQTDDASQFVNDIGCVDKVFETIEMLAIILIAVVAIEIFIFVISCVVCCKGNDEEKPI